MAVRIALVIGATGLVGSRLVHQLLADPRFGKVRVFARRPTGQRHAKLEEHRIDFDRLDEVDDAIRGDVLFSALGTTLRKAGSEAAQYRVDYGYQHEFARRAAANGVPVYVLISAAGASPHSRFFYMRMKGELERDVAELSFRHIHILQPGFLGGARAEHRPAERLGLAALTAINRAGLLRAYRPIPADTVARAMIAASEDRTEPLRVHGPQALFALGA
jgi:uncharacterized protein YbjT (DUF2867 family)